MISYSGDDDQFMRWKFYIIIRVYHYNNVIMKVISL